MLHVAQQQDPDLGRARKFPGKDAARRLLHFWLMEH